MKAEKMGFADGSFDAVFFGILAEDPGAVRIQPRHAASNI